MPTAGSLRIEPYRIDVAPAVIDDLRERLARSRLADEPPAAGWDYGTNREYLQSLIDYWRSDFDWFARQEVMNRVPQLLADLGGATVHLAHHRAPSRGALPIVLAHGWPSGYPEMTKLAPLLADPAATGGDPADAFDVVVPSFPGYGFAGAPRQRGFGYARTAEGLHRVMTEGLGYERYAVHGTGAGVYVIGRMALDHPESVVGFHTHDPALMPVPSFEPPAPPPSDDELAFAEMSRQWASKEGAYAELQRTKPQSIGHALNDSPAGLASWLVEKHRTWSDCHGDIERRYTKDELLTGFTIYWATGTIASSMRAYYERVTADPPVPPGTRLAVPTGVAMPRFEPNFPPRRAPRELVARTHDVRHWVDLPTGGHFASWEEPELVAESIRAFFRGLR